MVSKDESGLDMGKTIEWYLSSGVRLPDVSPSASFPYPIENPGMIGLSEREMASLFILFPENLREMSALRKVVGKPCTWFHRGSASGQPAPTTNPDEALSPTAIVPSFIDYTPWRVSKVPAADIWLYQLPEATVPEAARKIILSEGFIHEIGHSIVQPLVYTAGNKIKFPSRGSISGMDALIQFGELSEKHAPISSYASFYRGDNGEFRKADDPAYNAITAISEEMCEAIAAFFLGFAYCGDDARGKDPFADRPDVKNFLADFMASRL